MEKQLQAQKEQDRIAQEQAKAKARAEAEARARAQAEVEAAARAKAEREALALAQAQSRGSSIISAEGALLRVLLRVLPRALQRRHEAAGVRRRRSQRQRLRTRIPRCWTVNPSCPHHRFLAAQLRRNFPRASAKAARSSLPRSLLSRRSKHPLSSGSTRLARSTRSIIPQTAFWPRLFRKPWAPKAKPPQRQLNGKASHASLQTKPSLQSLKSSVSSTGRPKALELAAKRKEQVGVCFDLHDPSKMDCQLTWGQEEREAQRKRDAKAEMERKRAAMQEEERRKEHHRRAEAEKQKEDDQRQAVQAKKDAQRQAAIEKAKQTRAPPPAVRSQPNGPPGFNLGDKGAARPASRLGSTVHQDSGRPVNAVLTNASKMASKRPLQQEEETSRPQPQRAGPAYQSKESKRMRMSEEFDEDIDMADSQRNIKGPPVRPSAGFRKVRGPMSGNCYSFLTWGFQELPSKSAFTNGYTNAPPSATRDLFKATVTAQHNNQVKAAHPLDMAQVSKGAIPFASNPNPAGHSHKTPARPVGAGTAKSAAKSATRSSPRFQNGESIELPEIDTDDEDDDDAHIGVAAWADSRICARRLCARRQ